MRTAIVIGICLASGGAASGRGPVPPRVQPGATGWGGGSTAAPGHGLSMQEQPGSSPVAELLTVPSWDEFYSNYVRRNRPVVLRGHARSLRAFERWTDEYLVKHWGGRQIQVEINKTEERGGPAKEMPLRQFVQEMYKESRQSELYAIVDFDRDKKAQRDFDLLPPIQCQEVWAQSLTLWWSSGGTSSVLHQDDAENFLMLLAGNKSVMLVHQDDALNIYAPIAAAPGSSPVHQLAVDLEAFPRFSNIRWLHGVVGPGDTLYIPHTYWHQVNSAGRNLAANLWWGHKDDWQWWDPSNRREYNAQRFGGDGFPKFENLKARSPESLPCTPFAKGDDLSKARFMDEGDYKEYLSTERRKRLKRKHRKRKPVTASGEAEL